MLKPDNRILKEPFEHTNGAAAMERALEQHLWLAYVAFGFEKTISILRSWEENE